MGTVRCLSINCRYNNEGFCDIRPLHFIGTKCMDMSLRLTVFKGIRGEILCDDKGCSYNTNKHCTKTVLHISGNGCVPKERKGE